MQNPGIWGGGQIPSFVAQPDAKLCLFPTEKKTFVEQAGLVYRFARYKHAGAIERVKPIIAPWLRAVAHESNPQVDTGTCPGLYGCR